MGVCLRGFPEMLLRVCQIGFIGMQLALSGGPEVGMRGFGDSQ